MPALLQATMPTKLVHHIFVANTTGYASVRGKHSQRHVRLEESSYKLDFHIRDHVTLELSFAMEPCQLYFQKSENVLNGFS